MRFRLRTLLILAPIVAVVLTAYVFLQIKAIQVTRESNEFERARDAAVKGP
jgi:hypothetical protein